MYAYRNLKMKYNSSGNHSSGSRSLCWRSFRAIFHSNVTKNRWIQITCLCALLYFLTVHSSPPWIPLFQNNAYSSMNDTTLLTDSSDTDDASERSPEFDSNPKIGEDRIEKIERTSQIGDVKVPSADPHTNNPDGPTKYSNNNNEDPPYPVKMVQEPHKVPSSAVTPMPILPAAVTDPNSEPLQETNGESDMQEDSERTINKEEDGEINEEMESIQNFEPIKNKGFIGTNKRKSWKDYNKFQNHRRFKNSKKKFFIDEQQEHYENEEKKRAV